MLGTNKSRNGTPISIESGILLALAYIDVQQQHFVLPNRRKLMPMGPMVVSDSHPWTTGDSFDLSYCHRGYWAVSFAWLRPSH